MVWMTTHPLLIHRYVGSDLQRRNLDLLASEWQKDGAHPFWSAESIANSLTHPENQMWYAEEHQDSEWLGMTLMRIVGEDAELLYIHTTPSKRGQGLGKRLLRHVMHDLPINVAKIFLEVRPSNNAAQRLYTSLGFKMTGRRKKYYKDGEDALIFEIAVS